MPFNSGKHQSPLLQDDEVYMEAPDWLDGLPLERILQQNTNVQWKTVVTTSMEFLKAIAQGDTHIEVQQHLDFSTFEVSKVFNLDGNLSPARNNQNHPGTPHAPVSNSPVPQLPLKLDGLPPSRADVPNDCCTTQVQCPRIYVRAV